MSAQLLISVLHHRLRSPPRVLVGRGWCVEHVDHWQRPGLVPGHSVPSEEVELRPDGSRGEIQPLHHAGAGAAGILRWWIVGGDEERREVRMESTLDDVPYVEFAIVDCPFQVFRQSPELNSCCSSTATIWFAISSHSPRSPSNTSGNSSPPPTAPSVPPPNPREQQTWRRKQERGPGCIHRLRTIWTTVLRSLSATKWR